MPGTIYIVATPIGNLEDITLRALRVLKEVDVIAAEDTRRTAKLLAHYAIRTRMTSLHEHNEFREAPKLVDRVERGESVAVVSDAGTPGIADPGARLVALARARGVKVTPIPGPSAVSAALSVAGIESPEFVFLGFAPAQRSKRAPWFAALADEPRTVVFFEAPHRIGDALATISSVLVTRQITTCREISKIFESIGHITNDSRSAVNQAESEDVGEFTVIVHPVISPPTEAAASHALAVAVVNIYGCMTNVCGIEDDVALRATGSALGLKPSAVRRAVKKAAFAAKRLE